MRCRLSDPDDGEDAVDSPVLPDLRRRAWPGANGRLGFRRFCHLRSPSRRCHRPAWCSPVQSASSKWPSCSIANGAAETTRFTAFTESRSLISTSPARRASPDGPSKFQAMAIRGPLAIPARFSRVVPGRWDLVAAPLVLGGSRRIRNRRPPDGGTAAESDRQEEDGFRIAPKLCS